MTARLKDTNDIVGKKFGRLMVLERSRVEEGRYKNGRFYRRYYYLCQCSCGKEFELRRDSILSGHTTSCGCIILADLEDVIGKRFGKLVALKHVPGEASNGPKAHYYLCVCDCDPNKKIKVRRNDLITKKKPSCGCTHYVQGNLNKCWKGCGDISGAYWSGIKCGARKRKIPLNLTIDDAHKQLELQSYTCALTGWPISVHGYTGKESMKCMRTASLDRRDNTKGYEKGNIQWLHKDINKFKLAHSNAQVVEISRMVVSKQSNPEQTSGSFEGARDCNGRGKIWKSYKEIGGKLWQSIMKGAVVRELNVAITIEDAYNQFTKQKKHCALTGTALILHPPELRNGSLDRIDSSKGYESDNIQWILKEVNHMKWEFTEEYFIKICKAIVAKVEISTPHLLTSQ